MTEKEVKAAVQKEIRDSLQVLLDHDVELLIVEYFNNMEEMEWALEVATKLGKPVAASMPLGPMGEKNGVSVGECAVRMAKGGADIIGLNCLFDPKNCIETMTLMKEALDKAGIKKHLMAQPLGYRTPDVGNRGWVNIDEFPFALEPRQITRIDAAKFARAAYDLGVRYIGGCCGFESHHIRAMAEELHKERGGKLGEASEKSDVDFSLMEVQSYNINGEKGKKSYWWNLKPSSGLE